MELTRNAIRFTQTARTGWILRMTVEEMIHLAPSREPVQLGLFAETNRPVNTRHRGGIEKFLTTTPDWAIPPITLAASPNTVREQNEAIFFDPDALGILDGQHRIQAFGNVVQQLTIDAGRKNPGEARERLENMKGQELPVVIMEVRDSQEQRQIFAWFARSRPIEAAVREYFDNSDPFSRVAKTAMERSSVLQENINYKVRNVQPLDRDLMSLSQLKDVVTAIRLGITQVPNAREKAVCEEQEIQDTLERRTINFFDAFLPGCLPNYGLLSNPGEISQKIPNERSTGYALHPQVIRLAANAWARWTFDQGRDPDRLARYIGQMNVKGTDPTNCLVNEWGLLTGPRRKFQGLRHRSWDEATAAIIRAAAGN